MTRQERRAKHATDLAKTVKYINGALYELIKNDHCAPEDAARKLVASVSTIPPQSRELWREAVRLFVRQHHMGPIEAILLSITNPRKGE